VSWHPRGRILLAGSEDFTTWMWNVDTGATMGVLAGHNGAVTCGQFTPDGELRCPCGCALPALGVHLSGSGRQRWSLQEGSRRCHNSVLECRQELDLGGHSVDSPVLSLCPGKSIVTGSADGSLRVWVPRSGECGAAFQGHPFHAEGLTSLHVSADSALAISGSTDKTARLVHLHNKKVGPSRKSGN
jgi:WD40 repeat protein